MSDHIEQQRNELHPELKHTPPSVGILKEAEKEKLHIALGSLSKQLTKREILHLAQTIQTSNTIEDLKKELSKQESLKTQEISKEDIEKIYEMVAAIKSATEQGIDSLRLEVEVHVKSVFLEADKRIFPSHAYAFIKRVESSEMGDNILLDISGFLAGALDSAYLILREIFQLLKDLLFLPRDIYQEFQNRSCVCLWIINEKNEYLLSRRSLTKATFPGKWSCGVSGMMERFEGVEAAVERELQEELGITGVDIHFLLQEENAMNSLTTFHYLAKIETSTPLILQLSEVSETCWIDCETIETWIRETPQDFVPYFLINFGDIHQKIDQYLFSSNH